MEECVTLSIKTYDELKKKIGTLESFRDEVKNVFKEKLIEESAEKIQLGIEVNVDKAEEIYKNYFADRDARFLTNKKSFFSPEYIEKKIEVCTIAVINGETIKEEEVCKKK